MIGHSNWHQQTLETINEYAPARHPVLIMGETGTGKDVIANRIHERSGRAGLFLGVNCATLDTLADSELFGHHRGAFTGASRDTQGYIGCANGGTLFLDEIADLPKSTQVKLLRFLDSGEYYAVGSSVPKKADVRILCATNVDLKRAIQEGRFRQDLFFRLGALIIRTVPLRERKEDIPLLAAHYWKICAPSAPDLSPACLQALARFDWPGNVRELRSVIQRLALKNPLQVVPKMICNELGFIDQQPDLGAYRAAKEKMVRDFDRYYFVELSKRSGGSLSKALSIAGMHKKNYYMKLKEIGLLSRSESESSDEDRYHVQAE